MEVIRTASSQTGGSPARRSLIVEEDFLILNPLRETLVAAGFEVHCAAGPAEARRLLGRYRYEFVIVHLNLNPAGGDAGLDIIARAREWNPGSQIVALGPEGDAMPRGLCEALGAAVCYSVDAGIDRLRVQIARMARSAATPAPGQECQS